MTRVTWDDAGKHYWETGVDRGMLYPIGANAVYPLGVPWNGLTTVTESPSGAEPTPMWADNIKYLNVLSREDFGATIEAFTYPDEFMQCDGTATPQVGVGITQQPRKRFGMSYRTRLGNEDGNNLAYKLHLIYSALASPSEKAYATVNDSPEAITFSWEVSTTEVNVTGYSPTALVTVDSSKVSVANLQALEDALYGTAGTDPRLPLPDEVLGMFVGALVNATPVAPAYNTSTHVITIPTTTGIQYRRADTNANVADASTITLVTGQTLVIYAVPKTGYRLTPNTDDDFGFTY